MTTPSPDALPNLPPEEAADFVGDMLGQLAGLSEQAGMPHSSELIRAVIPVVELEKDAG